MSESLIDRARDDLILYAKMIRADRKLGLSVAGRTKRLHELAKIAYRLELEATRLDEAKR